MKVIRRCLPQNNFPGKLKKSRLCRISKVCFFVVVFLNMTDDSKIPEESNTTKEKIEGMAQVLIGEIESLGGVITGDPMTSAEGDFNIQVGTLQQETAEALAEGEEDEESTKSNETNQTIE